MDANKLKKQGAAPTCRALADEAADLVQAAALVQAGRAETLVHVDLTVNALESWVIEGRKEDLISFNQDLIYLFDYYCVLICST